MNILNKYSDSPARSTKSYDLAPVRPRFPTPHLLLSGTMIPVAQAYMVWWYLTSHTPDPKPYILDPMGPKPFISSN